MSEQHDNGNGTATVDPPKSKPATVEVRRDFLHDLADYLGDKPAREVMVFLLHLNDLLRPKP